MPAKYKTINGKRCRYYIAGGFCVSDNGTVAVKEAKNGYLQYLDVKTDTNGERFVKLGRVTALLKDAVYTCFCPPKPFDGKEYEVCYKDGNKANLDYKNLELREIVKTTTHSTASKIKLTNGIVVKENGEIYYGKQKQTIYDNMGDADTDLVCCILPRVSNPKGRRSLLVDDLMSAAGYVAGEKYSLKSPVILHKDNDPTNFHKDNLEWVESTDTRYIEYQKKVEEWKHQRNIELNPGRTLHPGW